MSSSIVLKTDEEKLVKNLKFSFSNSTTFIAELMQNSRRAQASSVNFDFDDKTKNLIISDDGIGISDFSNLLTIAKSGWSEDIVKQENPYGLGFLSALYACQKISVTSGLITFTELTSNILSLKPILLSDSLDDSKNSMIIKMIDVDCFIDYDQNKFVSLIKKYAIGFNLPIFVNGVEVERFNAIDNGNNFLDLPIGQCYLPGYQDDKEPSDLLDIYIQGFLVYSDRTVFSNNRNIIHLDSKKFFARLPDRDTLIDEGKSLDIIRKVVSEFWVSEITKQSLLMDSHLFLDKYYSSLKKFHCMSVMDKINLIHMDSCFEFSDEPSAFECCENAISLSSHVSKESVLSKEISLCLTDGFGSFETFPAEILAHKMGFISVDKANIEDTHWAYDFIHNLTTVPTVESNSGVDHFYSGVSLYFNVVLCDSYSISIGDINFVVDDIPLFFSDDGCDGIMYFPRNSKDYDCVHQASSFKTEYDYRESDFIDEKNSFEIFINSLINNDPAISMRDVLLSSGFNRNPSLKNTSLIIGTNLSQNWVKDDSDLIVKTTSSLSEFIVNKLTEEGGDKFLDLQKMDDLIKSFIELE